MGILCSESNTVGRYRASSARAWSCRSEKFTLTATPLTPGDRTPRSGQYEIIGSRGGHTGEERTSTRGNPLPPTPKSGQTYKLVDPTKN